MITLLRDLNLRRLWAAQAWSGAGEALALIAMPLLVYDITESARMVGLIALLLSLPRVVFAPIAGLLIDQFDRRRLIIGANIWRMALVSVIPFTDSVVQIGIVAVGTSIGASIARPAELAVVPSVAGPERLLRAISLMQVTNGIIRVIVPAAGAGIIAAVGPGPAFWLQAACYLLSLHALRNVVIPATRLGAAEGEAPAGSLWSRAKADIQEGLRTVRDTPVVRGVTGTEALWTLAGGALTVSGVIYTQEAVSLGDRAGSTFAFMMMAASAGAVFGALVAHRLETRIGRPRMLGIGYTAPAFLVFAYFTPPMTVLYMAWFAFGMTDAWAVITFQSYFAEAIPERLRGRVYSAFGATIALAGSISYYVVGELSTLIGAPRTFALAGIIVGLGGPVILWFSGALRAIRRSGLRVEG